MKSPQNMFCIGTYPLTTFLVSKLQSFAVNAWICFVKAMGTHALQMQSFGFVKAKFPSKPNSLHCPFHKAFYIDFRFGDYVVVVVQHLINDYCLLICLNI